MKRLCRTVILSCAVWAAAVGLHTTTAQAYSTQFGVKIQINDSLVQFPDVTPFIDSSGDMQMPLRPVAEQMGYHVDWKMDGSEVQITLQSDNRTIKLRTGSKQADVGGKPMTLTSPAQFKDGHVFVPARFISESFGYMVQWDNHNGIAIICKDGKYHSPAWWAPAPAMAPAQTAPAATAELIETATKYEGVPYAWGGTTPAGFDCSGFVTYVFNKQGIDLPRTSREMYDSSGSAVPASGLKPGDLVFFNIGQSTSHVGIYLGNDAFISATSSRGIHVDSLASGYWGARYIGAKRVV